MPKSSDAITDLRAALGNFLDRDREDGVLHVEWGGPGSVPALADLDMPELHLDLMPGVLTPAQQAALTGLGYVPEGEGWRHPGGWRVVLPDEGSGWRGRQKALGALLHADDEAARQYREVFRRSGRDAADAALQDQAAAHNARTVGWTPARFVAELLTPLDWPWMFAGGLALDLHLGHLTRPHDDLDVIVPRDQQPELRALLSREGWRTDAAVGGMYRAWTAPLDPPAFQVHARSPELPDSLLLDLMLTDLSGGLWHYRRDPSIVLPLEQARRVTSGGLPYLAPEAALLFKAGRAGQPIRPKDRDDAARVLPTLDSAARAWLRQALKKTAPDHEWLERL